ncbi:oligosaccharide flippase family protein [Puniceicoccaceae bacterium K14]|nr:oligosaccharide flippase family protein [Puniceicoccaceae bacterium K14]
MSQVKLGAILSYAVLGLNNIVGVLFLPFMISRLGSSEFGIFSLITSLLAYLTVLDFGFGNAVVRFTAKFKAESKGDKLKGMYGSFLVLYLFVGFIAFFICLLFWWNADFLFGDSMSEEEVHKIGIMLLMLSVNVIFLFPLSTFSNIVLGHERFVVHKVALFLRILLNTIAMVALVLYGHGAIALLLSTTVFNIICFAFYAWYAIAILGVQMRFGLLKWKELKEYVFYSYYVFLNTVMDKIFWSSGQLVLGMVSGATAVAIFSIGIQLQRVYMASSSAISGVMLPKVTKLVAIGGSRGDVSNLFIRVGRVQFIVLLYILFAFILFGKEFVSLWVGEEFQDAFIIGLMFFGALMVPLMQNVGISILQARNQMKFRSYLNLLNAFVCLVLQFVFSKYWGAVGCAGAIVVSLLVGNGLIMNIYYQKKHSIKIYDFWFNIFSMASVPVAVFFVCFCIKIFIGFDLSINLGIICFFIYTLTFFLIMWLFSLNEFEKKLVISLFEKCKGVLNRGAV